MSQLLRVLRLNSNVMKTPGKGKKPPVPLILEWAVNGDTSPYLVSSTSSVLWVEDPHEGNIIRAAVRKIPDPGVLFREILEAVAKRGKEDQWGNVHPFTFAGLKGAVDHVTSYDLDDLEILVPRVTKTKQRPDWMQTFSQESGFPLRPSSWMPDDCALVLPKDRDFVGVLGYLGAKSAAAVVHNASRGIAVVWGT